MCEERVPKTVNAEALADTIVPFIGRYYRRDSLGGIGLLAPTSPLAAVIDADGVPLFNPTGSVPKRSLFFDAVFKKPGFASTGWWSSRLSARPVRRARQMRNAAK
jgi:hypothetical protein